MIRYLIQRPVAVLMSFASLIVLGILLSRKVPVSLLPDLDVPQIIVRVDLPNMAAPTLEQNIIQPIRESLINIAHVKGIETRTANHTGLLYVSFDYSARMDLAYIEVNEKLDRLTNTLPSGLSRPQVVRVNTSDIPIVRIQVLPKNGTDYEQVSQLTEKVLRKRLEQIKGVSLVDINGKRQQVLTITPNTEALRALNLDKDAISSAIQNANRNFGGLTIADGQYRYFVRMGSGLETTDLAKLPLPTKNGAVILLGQVAQVNRETTAPTGFHLYNEQEGLVITVQKQADSRMNELVPVIQAAIKQFRSDYPGVEFHLTQDQTFLLDAGISNLYQDLVYGGLFTVALLFLFLGNWASPLLMSISIPVSLLITFVFFYLFHLSFNIISLSGLALGIGMLIDNSIVVIDSITRKYHAGFSLPESCVLGTNEVVVPVISQVLTTIAVYAPLILLNGMAGNLVFDQSIALTISLGVSLLSAFVLVPLLFRLFIRKPAAALKEDSRLYRWIAAGYHRMIDHILSYRAFYFITTLLLMPVGFWLATRVPVSSLPAIEKKESLLLLDWNEPIDASENLRRVRLLQKEVRAVTQVTEAEVGIKQFLLQQEQQSVQKAEIYYTCRSEADNRQAGNRVNTWLLAHFPKASLRVIDAPNAFTQLFVSNAPFFEARFKPILNGSANAPTSSIDELVKALPQQGIMPGAGLTKEPVIEVTLDYAKMALYGVRKTSVENTLRELFGIYVITEVRRFGESRSVLLKTGYKDLLSKLRSLVPGRNEEFYELGNFVSLSGAEQQRFITGDKSGVYQSVIYGQPPRNPSRLMEQISETADRHQYSVSFSGRYFDSREQLQSLLKIFLLVLFLLYIILAIQYEDLVQPLIVMLNIPLGITGAMTVLYFAGGTLDAMAAIGFIVVLGLIVDDPILKMETLNRLQKQYTEEGLVMNNNLMRKMIHEAGTLCLKPLLMVSLTTSMALVPVLFVKGIGNDLQKPLAYVIIGGLTIGTFFTTWFIPLAFWYVTQWRRQLKKHLFKTKKL